MKLVSIFANEIEEIISSLKPKVDFDYVSKDEGSKKLMEKPLTPNEVKNKTKNKSLMCVNIFQPMVKNSITMLQ
jgi:hypothetical protein